MFTILLPTTLKYTLHIAFCLLYNFINFFFLLYFQSICFNITLDLCMDDCFLTVTKHAV